LPLTAPIPRQQTLLTRLDADSAIAWDYAACGHSTRGHLIDALRKQLRSAGYPEAATIATLTEGTHVRYAGLVICRQQPANANGLTFLTLEDETGLVNVLVRRRIWQRDRWSATIHPFLAVAGKLQKTAQVVHVIAKRLWAPRIDNVAPVAPPSHDFR